MQYIFVKQQKIALIIFYSIPYCYRYEASFVSFNIGIDPADHNTFPLTIFPNPASELITIELTSQDPNTINTVCIYGMDGRELIQQKMQGSRSEINLASLPGGMYCIRVSNSSANWFGRFIKK